MMAVGWPDLVGELDRWGDAGRVATLWWRDDDAVAPSASLDRLFSIAGDVPVALAVIPAAAEPELGDWLSARALGPAPAILQHGWRHQNHCLAGKKSEFSGERRRDQSAAELAAGQARMAALFASHALPILVPPWNRFDDVFLPLLAECGLTGISRIHPRPCARPMPGIFQVNVHCDLVAWADDRAVIGEEVALGGLVGHLAARRLGCADADEPTGILTHHLVQQRATEAFLSRLISVIATHAAARWLDATEVFAPAILAER